MCIKKPMLRCTYVTMSVSGPGGPYGRPSLAFSGLSLLIQPFCLFKVTWQGTSCGPIHIFTYTRVDV